jgi:hypothetical protein
LASHQTTIQLVLRNPLDREVTKTQGVGLEQLFGGEKLKPVADAPVPQTRLHHRRAANLILVAAPSSLPPAAVEKGEPPVVEIILLTKRIENKF